MMLSQWIIDFITHQNDTNKKYIPSSNKKQTITSLKNIQDRHEILHNDEKFSAT